MRHFLKIARIVIAAGLFGMVLLAQTQLAEPKRTVFVRILDENGAATPARVRFTSLDSVYFAPEGHAADFTLNYGGDVLLDRDRLFAYVDGHCAIKLPEAAIQIEVVKGYAYQFVSDTLQISSGLDTVHIQLQRWFDFPDRQWYSGDVHVHHISPETALLEMQAEDLNVCNVLTSDFTSDQANFLGKPDPVSQPQHIVYVNQEYRQDRLGHMNLLNLTELVQPVKPLRQTQYPLNMAACDRTHAQGGHVSWAHFAAWPGLEGPLALVMQKVDAVELLCTIEPFHQPIFVSDVIPDVRMNSGLNLWYRLLNCGLRIPATAGTDKMSNRVTVGANRVYAAVDGDLTYQGWIDALNAGRTFISNSPLLFCRVNGKEAGETINARSGSSLTISAEVWTQLPVDRLELVANGKVIGATSLFPDQRHATLSVEYVPGESVWIAARCHQFTAPEARKGVSFPQRRGEGGGTTLFNAYYGTLRPETTFAHTSPVYVILDDRPVRSAQDAEYFADYLENAITWLQEKGKFPSDATKREVLQAFQQGVQMFRTRADHSK